MRFLQTHFTVVPSGHQSLYLFLSISLSLSLSPSFERPLHLFPLPFPSPTFSFSFRGTFLFSSGGSLSVPVTSEVQFLPRFHTCFGQEKKNRSSPVGSQRKIYQEKVVLVNFGFSVPIYAARFSTNFFF